MITTESPTIEANATLVAEDEKQLAVVAEQNHLQVDTAQSLQKQFAPLFSQARNAIEKSRGIVVVDASQMLEIKMARLCRLELKAIRVAGEKTRKEIKEESLRRSKAIDGFAAILNDLILTEETRLEHQEKFVEIQESNRKAVLKAEREKILVSIQVDPNLYALADMGDETFQQLVEGTKLARAAEQERKRKEEAERIEREAKEQAERERMRLENERLKKEAAEKESARIEADKKATIEREMAEKELKRLADEKRAAELKAKEEREAADAKVKAEREAAERETARQLAEQKRISDAKEREATETHERHKRVHAELLERERAAAAKEREAVEAKAKQERDATEAKAKAEREEHLRNIRAMEKASAEKAAKEKAARDELEAKIKATREAEEQRVFAEKEAARKAAAAPDKDRLLNYANAIRSIDIPAFSTAEGQAIATTIAASRDRFADWCEQKAFAL